MDKGIPQSFYNTADAVTLAQNLLGKILKSEIDGVETAGIIVETEAYMAPDDLACHARGNRRTPRTETMFAEAGTIYVYKCYGIHDLFNVVSAPQDVAHAILIRAVEPIIGVEYMMKRRKMKNTVQLVNGPGKFTRAMGITTMHDGLKVYSPDSPIRIMFPEVPRDFNIVSGPRVGMSHHTKHCGHYPWRFRVEGNRWTSKPDVVVYDY